MTFIDYGFFIIIIISSLLGCYRGFVRELLSIIAWFFAFYLAQSFSPIIASKLHWIDTESIRNLVAYVDRKSKRLNSSHITISYAVFCLKKKIIQTKHQKD